MSCVFSVVIRYALILCKYGKYTVKINVSCIYGILDRVELCVSYCKVIRELIG